jgi:hypothetical protein
MTDLASLERGYRRLLACYPRAFRRESEQEILAVLMATAREDQRRVGLAESADLIRGALRLRLRPPSRPPRTVFTAVRLMCLGAVAELAAWITIVLTAGRVKSAMVHGDPAQWNAVLVHLVAVEVFGPIAVGLWLWMAWANGRGNDGARLAFTAFFALMTLSLLGWLAEGAAVYAPAALVACAVLCLIQLAAVVLIFSKKSNPYYRRELAERATER